MNENRTEMPIHPDMIWDLLIRLIGAALLLVLIVAYFTGEEIQHTHAIIGYAVAGLLAVGVFWALVRPRAARFPSTEYSVRGIKRQIENADRLPRTLASAFLIMAALPFGALILMLLTHTLWGTTRIDEMHEVVAYFAVGLVACYIAMVVIASIGYMEGRMRKLFQGNKNQR
ncbi:hypothetical protein [Rhodoblastus sp.]|uniref:hypothetical protein n=1 Tax=Rhodoblastus sp. TaxID=1962975 RepID=UPI0026000305|nr:hypothetical protein [Rhodoblastus sp.]